MHLMEVWITKYLFTRGIVYEDEAEQVRDDMLRIYTDKGVQYLFGKEWHLTEGLARVYAREMVQKRKTVLKKQLAKVEKLEAELCASQ